MLARSCPSAVEQIANAAGVGAERVVAPGLGRLAVSDQVGRDHRESSRQVGHHPLPGLRARGDPVDQHDHRAAPGLAVGDAIAVQGQACAACARSAASRHGSAWAPRPLAIVDGGVCWAHVCSASIPDGRSVARCSRPHRCTGAVPRTVRGVSAGRSVAPRNEAGAAIGENGAHERSRRTTAGRRPAVCGRPARRARRRRRSRSRCSRTWTARSRA